MEALETILRNTESQQDYVYSPDPVVSTYITGDQFPEFELNFNKAADSLEISFSLREDISFSTVKEKFIVTNHNYKAKSFVHDFTFNPLSEETDSPLGTYFTKAPETYKALTPDVCIIVNATLFIIEFATTQSSNRRALKESYNAKRLKYLKPIFECFDCMTPDEKMRLGFNSVGFYVIVIGRGQIYSNLQMDDFTKNELGLRFELALRIINKEKIMCIFPDQVGDLTEDEAKLHAYLTAIRPGQDKDDSDIFSFNNYQRMTSSKNENEIKTLLRKALALSSQRAIDSSKFCLSANKDRRIEMSESHKDKYFQSFDNNTRQYSESLKSVLNIPFFTCKHTAPDVKVRDHLKSYLMGSSKDHTFYAWLEAVTSYEASNYVEEEELFIPDNLSEEDLINQLNSLEVGEMNNEKLKKLYHRTRLSLGQDIWVQLAKQGVNGKMYKDNKEVKEKVAERKKPFNLSVDCSDIEDFLNGDLSDLFCVSEELSNPNFYITHLALKALSNHGKHSLTSKYSDFAQRIKKIKIMKWSKIVSDIATELAISMKQHCKRDEFVIKKLKDFSCFLLIKPTKSSSHIFFSILVLKKDMEYIKDAGKVFRNFHENQNCYWTEFVSLNEAKIVNWTLTESRSMSMIPYWLEFNDLPPFVLLKEDADSEDSSLEDKLKESYKMILFTTLVALADKPEIEEHLTNIRHMTMEAFTSYPNYPKPYKMFEKFSNQFRSRLTVFITKKLISYNDHIVNGNIHSVECEGGAEDLYTMTGNIRNWVGLINPITGYPLTNPGQIINLMYLGYIKNKNEKTELNAESELLVKILSLEEKFTPDIKARIGRVNKIFDSGTSHEYNIDLIKHCCDYALDKKKLFSTEQAGKDLMSLISSTYVEDVFMTLKASSNFDDSYFLYSIYSKKEQIKRETQNKMESDLNSIVSKEASTSENFADKNYYKRSKIIEKSVSYIEGDKVKLIDILPICYQELQSNGHMRICIFKKQQHGGLREIFVLNFAERVVQYVIEQAGRLLCSYYPGETMTHPDSKRKIPEQHASQSKQYNKKGITITTFTSADASKWSQNHYPHKFAIMFVRLFPTEWHGLLWNSLSLWRNKRIKIGDKLLDHFNTGMGLKFYDSKIQNIYEGFKGINHSKWIKRDHSYIEVETGMMQGILHYTSSAFHTLMNTFVEKEIRKHSRGIMSHINCIVSTMQSSDDSGMILTLNSTELERNRKSYMMLLKIMYALHEFKNVINAEVSIINSVKSVIHCSRVFEFNSKFFFANFHYEPDIKLLFASQIISERESLIERQEELSTLLSSYVETGGSFYSAFFVQYGQLLSCYRALGSGVSIKFQLLATCLLMMPEPSIGFFLLDNPVGPGLSGFGYNVWLNAQNPRVSAAYRSHLDRVLTKSPGSKLETTNLGLLVRQSFLQFGARYKLEQLKRRIKCPKDWVEQIDAHPILLFREAQNSKEYMLKVALKLNQRGVSESLSTGVSTTSIMASSAYILNSAIFTILDDESIKTQTVSYKGEKRKKATLLSMIQNCLVAKGESLTENQENILFPYVKEFISLKSKFDSVEDIVYVRRMQEKRRVITSIEVLEKDQGPLISTMSVLKMKWFESEFYNKTPYSKRIIERVFELLKESISWLSETFEETLRLSPFDHAHQMVNWFIRLQTKSRIMCLLGAPISTQKGRSTINSALNMNFHKSYVLHRSYQHDETISSLASILHQVIGISSFPMSDYSRKDNLARLLLENRESIKFDSSRNLSRTNSLATIMELISQTPDITKAINQIEQNKRGYCGSWVIRQRFAELEDGTKHYTGKGVWCGIISGVKSRIEVGGENVKGCVTVAYVLDWKPSILDDFVKGMKSWLKDNHLFAPELSYMNVDEQNLLMYFNNGYNMVKLGFPVIKASQTIVFDIKMEERTSFEVDTEDWKSFIKKDVSALRLLAIDENGRKTTMISIPLYPSDWNITSPPAFSSNHTNYALTSWVSNRPMKLEQCVTTINYQRRNKREELLMLMRRIIINRLNTIGVETTQHNPPEIISSNRVIQQDMDNTSDCSSTFEDDLDLEDALNFEAEAFDTDEDIDEMIGTDDSISGVLEMDYDLDIFIEMRQTMGERIINGSGLFNRLIESWKEIHTVSRLNKLIKTGLYLGGEQSLINNYFSWIFPTQRFCYLEPDYNTTGEVETHYDPFST